MSLETVADGYLENLKKIDAKIAELRERLEDRDVSSNERYFIQKKLFTLENIRCENKSIGNWLKNYYKEDDRRGSLRKRNQAQTRC